MKNKDLTALAGSNTTLKILNSMIFVIFNHFHKTLYLRKVSKSQNGKIW